MATNWFALSPFRIHTTVNTFTLIASGLNF